MNQTFEIRCSNKRPTRGGDVVCRRYLGKIDERSITIICPRCGRRFLITREGVKGLQIVRLPEEKLLDSKPEECKE